MYSHKIKLFFDKKTFTLQKYVGLVFSQITMHDHSIDCLDRMHVSRMLNLCACSRLYMITKGSIFVAKLLLFNFYLKEHKGNRKYGWGRGGVGRQPTIYPTNMIGNLTRSHLCVNAGFQALALTHTILCYLSTAHAMYSF